MLTCPQIHGYRDDYPICDSHLHLYTPHSLETSVKTYADMMDFFRYDRLILHPLVTNRTGIAPTRNLRALYLKDRINAQFPDKRVYVFGSLLHHADGKDTADGFVRQAKELMQMGCDGIKMLEGKPGLRRRLGYRLDDPILDPFYSYLEENRIPVTMHAGDPAAFWDRTKVSDKVIKAGWFCDETYPKLESIREEVIGILKKHSSLRLNLAHFFFLAEDLEACIQLMETWPNLTFGLTPGGEMFAGFTKRPSEWRKFFQTYASRLHFGTDANDSFFSENPVEYDDAMGDSYNLVRRMLETSEPFEYGPKNALRIPLSLDDETIYQIYRGNFLNHFGAEPRPVDPALVAKSASDWLTLYEHRLIPQFETGEVETDYSTQHKFTLEEQFSADMESLRTIYNYFTQK